MFGYARQVGLMRALAGSLRASRTTFSLNAASYATRRGRGFDVGAARRLLLTTILCRNEGAWPQKERRSDGSAPASEKLWQKCAMFRPMRRQNGYGGAILDEISELVADISAVPARIVRKSCNNSSYLGTNARFCLPSTPARFRFWEIFPM